jgi:hypothetical protein
VQLSKEATFRLASSSMVLTSRPWACTDDGLPKAFSIAFIISAITRLSMGVVAALSRYIRSILLFMIFYFFKLK